MSQNSWHTSFASVVGTSHQKQGTVCQDAGLCERIQLNDNSEILLAVVSDGAGSASKSDIGSRAIVELFMTEFKKSLLENNNLGIINKAFVVNWLEYARKYISNLAEESGLTTREYACTVLGAIIGTTGAVFFQLGDGAIIVSKNESEEYSPIFWPQHGEYANQTNFVVQNNFIENLEFAYLEEPFDKIALFTDGLERLVLDFNSHTAHAPAFSTIFNWLITKELDKNNLPCPALTAYLNSEYINSRTDDDKNTCHGYSLPIYVMHTLNHQLKMLSTGPIHLGKELGKGGEGSVFTIKNSSDLVVKTYHTSLTCDKSAKIIAMIGLKNDRLLKLAAWPLASYHEKDGKLSGFIMPYVKNYFPLFELYNPSLRLQKFPQADWRFLVHAAINVAKAFTVIHEAGHVIGDVNHGNLLVAQDATVRFIDTDSFQIYTNSKYWLCEVGVPSYQPPEMQQSSFKDIIRTPNHDNFGLAILIFHLLFLGRHPFSGRFQGKGEMPLEKAISEYRFAYSSNQQLTKMLPPPASLPVTGLSFHLQSLFERAFSREACGDKVGLRPTPDEWISALSEFLIKLKPCSINEGHYYFKDLNKCPWCDIERLSGPMFPFRIINQKQSNTASSIQPDLEKLLEQTIKKINQSTPLIVSPKFIFKPSPPTTEAISLNKKLKFLQFHFFCMILFSIIFIPCIVNLIIPWYIIIILTLIGISTAYDIRKKNLSNNFINIINQFSLEKDIITKLSTNNFNNTFEELKKKISELYIYYHEINSNRLNIIKQHERNLCSTRLQSTLLNTYIKNANIEGIGPERIKILKIHGIETAFDIEYYRLQGIPGFGKVFCSRLINWRQNLENFTNAQPINLTSQQITEIDKIIEGHRDYVASELADTFDKYTKFTQQLNEHNKTIELETAMFVEKYSQVHADAQILGYKF